MPTRTVLGALLMAGFLLIVWGDQALAPVLGVRAPLIVPMLALLVVGAALEVATLCRAAGCDPVPGPVIAGIALLGFALIATVDLVSAPPVLLLASATAGLTVGALLHGAVRGRIHLAANTLAPCMLAFAYIGLLAGMVLEIRLHWSGWVMAAVLVLTKSFDIGAYFTGKAIGKRKLTPRLSPGKTWEGLIGGFVFAGVTGWLIALIADAVELRFEFPVWKWVLLGLVTGGAGQFGDLVASALKRAANVKDSSNALPGFGGLLDMLDSPLLGGVVGYWTLVLLTTTESL